MLGETKLEVLEKFCPICKNKNDRYAIVCIHCGAPMEDEKPTGMARTTRNTGGLSFDLSRLPDSVIDNSLIPDDGIAIYAAGTLKPYYLRIKGEFVIGRKAEETSSTFLDLSELDGYNMGISRRHVMICRADNGYEVTDLSSTNGTWMNDERLVPNKPYRLKNGAQLRVGRLRLLVTYRSASEVSEER